MEYAFGFCISIGLSYIGRIKKRYGQGQAEGILFPNLPKAPDVVRNPTPQISMRSKLIAIFVSLLVIVAGGYYLIYLFFSGFAPAKVKITERYISTNHDFINGVTISKINVDSIGIENYPVKYTVTYWTTCSITHPKNKPPNPPDIIYFKKAGKYIWTEEDVNINFVLTGSSIRSTDSIQRIEFSMGDKELKICPLEFKKEEWYFFTLSDPQINGIFFYIDKKGKPHQYTIHSGVSPI